jgi:hypothetical protein
MNLSTHSELPALQSHGRSSEAIYKIVARAAFRQTLMREMVRWCRLGGWAIVTTPNQLSLASKAFLFMNNQFPAFQEAPGLYPTHITALLEIDLIRISRECSLVDLAILYTHHGRIPFMRSDWPSSFRGRAFSDNLALLARRPRVESEVRFT